MNENKYIFNDLCSVIWNLRELINRHESNYSEFKFDNETYLFLKNLLEIYRKKLKDLALKNKGMIL